MKLRNTTDFPDYFLRRLVSWCCRELELPASKVRQVTFANSRGAYGGCAYLGNLSVGVRIGPPGYFPCKTAKHYDGLQETLVDRTEGLVAVTAHELAHLEQYRRRTTTRRGGFGGSERLTDAMAFRCLRAFREQRDSLLAEWSEPPAVRPAKPKPSVVEQRAAKIDADLARWNRKLKLAQTKIRKLKKRAAYYSRKLGVAATSAPATSPTPAAP